jgi:hypothetical protein
MGDYGLYYLRTKDQVETDFVVIKNGKPWFIVEVKAKASAISQGLYHFQKEINPLHAFQVVFDAPFVQKNCFEEKGPIVVPAKTFLAQLI